MSSLADLSGLNLNPPNTHTHDTKPHSYGLTFRWAPAGAVPGYYPHSVGNHMQQAPAPGPAPPQQVYYMPAPGGQPAQVYVCVDVCVWMMGL